MNRRTFIARTAGGVIAATVAPLLPIPEPVQTFGNRFITAGVYMPFAASDFVGIPVLINDGTYRDDYLGISRE